MASLREELKAARISLAAGRFSEFAERALRLEAESSTWATAADPEGLRRETDAMLTTLAHVAAVRDRLLAIRGGDGGYNPDGTLATPAERRLRREG